MFGRKSSSVFAKRADVVCRKFITLVGDVWTEEQVNDVYGDSSFEDALADRQSGLDHMSDIISKVIDK